MKNELSQRESTVLTLAVKGYTDDMIARELGIERGTVNSYWVRMRGKMGNFSRTELVARFVQQKADTALEERTTQMESDATELALEQKDLLGKALAEIEKLKAQLEVAKRNIA